MKTSSFYNLIFFISLFIVGCTKDKNPVIVQHIAPIVNAGQFSSITLPTDSATLSGSAKDSGGYVVSYLWSQVSGPQKAVIINPGAKLTQINGLVQGTYLFQLMATDNNGLVGSDTVSIIVNPPIIKTFSLQPTNNVKEKMLINIGGVDQSITGGNEWIVDAWTVNGSNFIGRSIFYFDLSSIPSTATILSANLYLYSNEPPENGNLVNANYGSDNSLILQQVSSNWSTSSVSWFNQPTVITNNQITISSTTLSALDINIDVTSMVKSMVNNNSNYGFLLKLANEVAYTSRAFVSSFNAAKSGKHPKLVINYSL